MNVEVRSAGPSGGASNRIVLRDEDEGEVSQAEKTALTTYMASLRVPRSEQNCSLDGGRTISVNVAQFFDGAGFFIGKFFGASSLGKQGKLALLAKLVEEHVLQYEIAQVHYARFPHIFSHFLSEESEEDLSMKIASLIHLIDRWKSIAGMTSFLLLTQPASYKDSSYADVLECLQRLVNLYETGFVQESVVNALNDFHSNRIPIAKLLGVVHEAESSAFFFSKNGCSEEGEARELKNLHDISDIIARGGAKQQSNLDSFFTIMNTAKTILKNGSFSLLLNPISYYHVADITPMKNMVHLLEIMLQKGGMISSSLEEFYKARLSLRDLERALEKSISQMASCAGDEEHIDSVLARFSFLTTSEKSSMREEYQLICKRGERLCDVGMNTLVIHARIIQDKCRKGVLSKEDSLFLLAIARESIRKQFGIYPHNTQMLTLLGLLTHSASIKGRIAQVKTGEGKSTIIAMLALYLACQGKYIDIISSSRYLAQRDAEKYEPFFNRFGIASSHLCTDSPSQVNFSGQIIFSTNFDAEFAVMRDYFCETGMRTVGAGSQVRARPFDVVIVDEVDNLFIDSALNSARIAIEGTLSIRDVYIPLFQFAKENEKSLRSLLHSGQFAQTKEFATAKQIFRESVKGSTEMIELFLDERVEMLLRSAIGSLDLFEGRDYIIRSVGDTKEIVIVDQANTGRLAEKSKWSHGLHQFLGVKHGLPIEEEYVMPASLCHPTFFGSFQRIYGLTGTIGSQVERREIHETYAVNTFGVPPHRPCLRKDLEPIVCLTQREQYDAVVKDIAEMVARGRPTLVLCESIQQAEDFAFYSSSQGISSLTLTACQADDEDYIITQAGFPGKVTIATNTAGRGTDIVLQKEARVAGGLHVIFSYLPANERVEQQGIGRAGRQGQPGSSRVILLVDNPILALISNELKEGDRALLHKMGYGLFLQQRAQKVAKLSSERMLRTKIEQVNHGYLLRFVKEFQRWLETSKLSIAPSCSQSTLQDKENKKQCIQQAWAEQFYTRLDELLVNVQQKCLGKEEEVVASYKLEIQKFYESRRLFWEKFL